MGAAVKDVIVDHGRWGRRRKFFDYGSFPLYEWLLGLRLDVDLLGHLLGRRCNFGVGLDRLALRRRRLFDGRLRRRGELAGRGLLNGYVSRLSIRQPFPPSFR